MKLNKSDQKQLKALKDGNYEDTSLYIVLLDLCQGCDVTSVYAMLHNVASDMRKKGELEEAVRLYKTATWPKYK